MAPTWRTTQMHTAFIRLFLGNIFSLAPSLSLAQLNLAPEALRLMPYVVTLSLTSFPNCRRLIRADETQALRNSCHTTELKLLSNAKCSVSLAQTRHLLPPWAFRQASENLLIACTFLKNITTNIKIQMLMYVLGIFSSLLTENSTIFFAGLLSLRLILLGMIIGHWQRFIYIHYLHCFKTQFSKWTKQISIEYQQTRATWLFKIEPNTKKKKTKRKHPQIGFPSK